MQALDNTRQNYTSILVYCAPTRKSGLPPHGSLKFHDLFKQRRYESNNFSCNIYGLIYFAPSIKS